MYYSSTVLSLCVYVWILLFGGDLVCQVTCSQSRQLTDIIKTPVSNRWQWGEVGDECVSACV